VSPQEAKEHPLYGVKNWLAVFAFVVLIGPLQVLGNLNAGAYEAGITTGQLLAYDWSNTRLLTVCLGYPLAIAAVLLWLLFTLHPRFRVLATVILVGNGPLYLLIAASMGAMSTPGVAGVLAREFVATSFWLIVWAIYLHRSRRVRVTFEHCVLAKSSGSAFSWKKREPSGEQWAQAMAELANGTVNKGVSATASAREVMTSVGSAALKLDTDPSEGFWSEASAELESTSRRPGLWARVFSDAKGNESLAKANYLQHRALELQQQHDAKFEQARRDVEEVALAAAIAQQAAKEHGDAAVPKGACPNCNAIVPLGVKRCPKCPAVFGPQSASTLRPIMAAMGANPAPSGRIAAAPGDVPPWVTRFILVMAGVAVVGVVAAVALPAYQDYAKRQHAAANPYGSPDNPITRDTYVEMVMSLLAKVDRGEIPSVEGLTSSDAPKSLTQWPDAATPALEANQTWWRSQDNDFAVHVVNPTAHDLVVMGMDYSNKGCASNGEKKRFFVALGQPIGPGSQAVVRFRAEFVVVDAATGPNCLEIASAWKALNGAYSPNDTLVVQPLKPFNGQLDLSEFQKPPSPAPVSPSPKPTAPAPLRVSPPAKLLKPSFAEIRRTDQDPLPGSQVIADLNFVADRAFRDFPFLNTASGDVIVERIIADRDQLIRSGVYPAIALTRAINSWAPAHAEQFRLQSAPPVSSAPAISGSHSGISEGCRWITPTQWSCK